MFAEKRRKRRVLHFVLIPGGRAEIRQQITRLQIQARAVVDVGIGVSKITELRSSNRGGIRLRAKRKRVGGVVALLRVGDEFVVVRLRATDLVVPVRTGVEGP